MTDAAERKVQESSVSLIRFDDMTDSCGRGSKMEQWSVSHRGRNYRLTVTTWDGGARMFDLRSYSDELCVFVNIPSEEECSEVLKVFRSLTD